ncbi:esterase family protein [Xylanibacillus composti]|nr:alpha/beta hydrolase family protein [Xylanibacillus composti]MDT9723864.1 esterase family protein [Xylanibacillus composti]
MALIQCKFYSEVLKLSTSMTVILPQQTRSQIGMEGRVGIGDSKHQTLYLLHGYTDDDSIWTRRTSIERYVAPLGLAVVMPNVHKSFYTDMKYGDKYWTFLTEELPMLARSFFPLSEKREDNFVAGLSMGGYGAFKWALRCPDQISAAASLSGALDMAGHIQRSPVEPPEFFHLIYGEEDIAGTPEDLLWLVEQSGRMKEKPALYQCCGTEDFLYEDNQAFRRKCEEFGYGALTYQEGPGGHVWEYWDEHIQNVLQWLPLRKA